MKGRRVIGAPFLKLSGVAGHPLRSQLEGKRYLSRAAMDELRKEQTGATKVNYSLGYHLRNGMFGHDGAYGTDLSVNPATGMVAVFMVQCTGGDQWAARDLFLKTATQQIPTFQITLDGFSRALAGGHGFNDRGRTGDVVATRKNPRHGFLGGDRINLEASI